jgi:hypothetical protein
MVGVWAILAAASPHAPAYALRAGVSSIEPAMVVRLGPGVDPGPWSAAAAQLDTATGARWVVTVGPATNRPGEVVVEVAPRTACANTGPDWGCTHGAVLRDGRVIWAQIDIAPDIPTANRPWVALHELGGHAVGLDHVDDPAEVMHPGVGWFTTYQPGDLAGLRHLVGR